jgi:hypothetical protein
MADLIEGWYADPSKDDVERFFDGSDWTDKTRAIEPGRTTRRSLSPGWYPDPKRLRDERWFDGTVWTVETRNASQVIGRKGSNGDPVDLVLRELRWIRASGIAIFILLLGLVLIVLGSGF